jgi:hypothetical protein
VVSSGSVSDLQQDEQPFLKERRMNKNSPPEGKKSYHPRQKNESQGKIWETHFTTTFYVPYRHSLPNSTARRTNLTPCLSLKLSQPERCRGDPRAAGLRDRRNMTGRSSPRTGPIKRPCLLRLLKNDWPKRKEGYGGTHLGPSRQLRSQTDAVLDELVLGVIVVRRRLAVHGLLPAIRRRIHTHNRCGSRARTAKLPVPRVLRRDPVAYNKKRLALSRRWRVTGGWTS